MDQGHRRWILHYLARPHLASSPQASPQGARNHPGTSLPAATKCSIHQDHRHLCHRQKYSRHDYTICSIEVTGKVSTDQTGRFPVTSSRGSKYLMVLYNYDSNAIITEPLKSRIKHELVCAYSALHAHFSNCGITLHLQMIDNEFPVGLKKVM